MSVKQRRRLQNLLESSRETCRDGSDQGLVLFTCCRRQRKIVLVVGTVVFEVGTSLLVDPAHGANAGGGGRRIRTKDRDDEE